jgi:tetratricopeptide (TPR) repeat protein
MNIGRGLFIIQHDPVRSLELIAQGLELFKEVGDKKWIANAYLTQSIIANSTGKRELALYSAIRGIDYYEHHPEDQTDRGMAYYFAGTVYKDSGKEEEAEKFYLKGIAAIDGKPGPWIGRIQTSLSGIYANQERYDEALELALVAVKGLRGENNYMAESRALTDVGVIYKKLRQYDKALANLMEGLALREEHNIRHFTLTSFLEIADLHSEMGNTNEAITYLIKAEQLALEINLRPKLGSIYQGLALAYKKQEDHKTALFYFEKFLALTLEITKTESEKRFNDLQTHLLQEKEQEIERLRNVELKNAYQVISEKQKEILDSIHYAKRIQQSLLPTEKMIINLLERVTRKK